MRTWQSLYGNKNKYNLKKLKKLFKKGQDTLPCGHQEFYFGNFDGYYNNILGLSQKRKKIICKERDIVWWYFLENILTR